MGEAFNSVNQGLEGALSTPNARASTLAHAMFINIQTSAIRGTWRTDRPSNNYETPLGFNGANWSQSKRYCLANYGDRFAFDWQQSI